LPTSGTFRFAVIPIHFADVPPDETPLGRVRQDMSTFVEYFKVQSYGKVTFQLQTLETSVLLPGLSGQYEKARSTTDTQFAQLALTAADPIFDFTGIHSVIFVLPKNQRFIKESLQGFAHSSDPVQLTTNEGRVRNYFLAGNYFDEVGNTTWSYWAHEVMHAFSLPDLYAQPWSSAARDNLRKGWPIQGQGGGPMHGWDLMASQDGPSRSITLWTKWIRGWLDESQVRCIAPGQLGTIQLDLLPIEQAGSGIRALMIPFSTSRALVIESRRETAFNLANDVVDEGVFVYEIDTSYGHGQMPLMPIKTQTLIRVNNSTRLEPYFDALMDVNEVLKYETVSIRYDAKGLSDSITVSVGPLSPAQATTTTTSTTTVQSTTTTLAPRAAAVLQQRIVCQRGAATRVVRGPNPKCPAGFKRRKG
jgi:M6 family metalloprotease-like protein